MLHVEAQTKRSTADVMERAQHFFGDKGLGLEVESSSENCAFFTGGGGYVHVVACENDARTEVDVETREWDQHAKQFLKVL